MVRTDNGFMNFNDLTIEECWYEKNDGFCININDGEVVSITEDETWETV